MPACYNAGMRARISFHLPLQPLRRVLLSSDRTYLIGRGPDCDIQLDDARLSRCHASLVPNSNAWTISDLDSKNGLLVDGRPVISHAEVRPPAWLSLGGVMGRFESVSEETLEAERAATWRRWDTTQELRRALDPQLGLPRLLDKTLDSVLKLAQLHRGFVLLTGDDGHLRVAVQRALDKKTLRETGFNGSWGAIRLALEQRRVIAYGDALESETLGVRSSIVQGEIHALVCVPLCISDQVHGAVYGDSSQPGKQFTELDVELLDALGGQAAVAIGIARVKQSLGELQQHLPAEFNSEMQVLPDTLSRALRAELPAYRPPRDHEPLVAAERIDAS